MFSFKIFRFSYIRSLKCIQIFYSSQPQQVEKHVGKVVNVAIIGAPNSGKSTLINNIVERKVSSYRIPTI